MSDQPWIDDDYLPDTPEPGAEAIEVDATLDLCLPEAEVRKQVLTIIADAVVAAHRNGSKVWSLSHRGDVFRLNVGRAENLSLSPGGLYIVVQADMVDAATRQEVEAEGWYRDPVIYKTLPTSGACRIPAQRVADLYPLLQEAHHAAIMEAAQGVEATPYRRSHSPVLLRRIGEILSRELPEPEMPGAETRERPLPPPPPPRELLQRTLSGAGLRYDPHDLAAFYTALQTKGFVVLSGITGTGKTKLVQHLADLLPSTGPGTGAEEQPPRSADEPSLYSNCLFLSVRPDWRDVKSLVGYHNPLANRWEWTPFLSFVVAAAESYRKGDGLARFVVLDEMNLAHVEHYFADLLSVMESGRGPDGFTREPLRLGCPDDAEGKRPPPELYLPPNLYLVGTVNMDETTYAFSPKVLDRAFTIELSAVDFRDYPPAPDPDAASPSQRERQALLDAFSRGGRHARIDKQIVADHVEAHPEVRDRLSALHGLLEPRDMHFGYRVFDEIVCFLEAAEQNGMYDFADGEATDAAFDAAVLMKVLPKFHGSRGKLEAPLLDLLAWCEAPGAPAPAELHAAWREAEYEPEPTAVLAGRSYRLPRTAERVIRMLRTLRLEGFAAFG